MREPQDQELIKLRIKYERAKRQHEEARKRFDEELLRIRAELQPHEDARNYAYWAWYERARKLGWCAECGVSLEKCPGHPMMATPNPETTGRRSGASLS